MNEQEPPGSLGVAAGTSPFSLQATRVLNTISGSTPIWRATATASWCSSPAS